MAKTGSERTKEWRAALVAAGYKQKAMLLSPQALKALKKVRDRFGGTDAESVELALKELAGKGNK